MDDDPVRRQPSPFAPGFNQTPAVLAGREDVLDGIDEALAIAAEDGRVPAPLVIVGPRGVGKTVLLGEAAARAAQRYGWPRLHVELSSGARFTPDLVQAATEVLAQLDVAGDRSRRSETIVRAQVAGIGAEMHFTAPEPPSPNPRTELRRALREVVDRAARAGAGVVLTVDELQSADKGELLRLAAVLQEGTGNDRPVVVVTAGLVDVRNPDRAITYLERGNWFEIGSLREADTRQALQVTAEGGGRPFEPDALTYLAGQTGGYPYAVQMYGHHAWRASAGQDSITLTAAQAGAVTASRRLDEGLYASRWEQASPKERQYLAAVADAARTEAPTGAEVATLLQTSSRSVSYLRDSLTKKGTLVVSEGRLHFTVPGMAAWVRQRDRPDRH